MPCGWSFKANESITLLGLVWAAIPVSDSKCKADRGPSSMDSVLALHPAAPGLIPGVPKNFSEFLM